MNSITTPAGAGDSWRLEAPLDPSGELFDTRRVSGGGERLDIDGLVFPVRRPGLPLDVTYLDGAMLVSQRVASLIAGLAPDDVQRIPARVTSTEEPYEVLNTLTTIDCVDRERTRAQIYVGDPPQLRTGTVASLGITSILRKPSTGRSSPRTCG